MSTPNMGLVLPVVSSTPGPLYASENNQAFSVIDAHDHSPGNGAPIPTAAISINADLPFNSYNASLLRSSRYTDQSSPLSLPADIRSLYVVGGNLYYNNGIGQQIQITAGAALNASSIGGIGGDYVTSSASVFYTSLNSTFTFWSATNTPAAIDAGPLTIRTITTSPFGITLNSPNALSADYSLTLPLALPVSTKILTVDPSGNIADVYDVDNSTIVVSSNVIMVPAQGITSTQIANGTIVDGNIANNTITNAKLASDFLKSVGTYQVFSTPGSSNFTVPAGVTYVRVLGCGGGGGGGGGSNPHNNSGGGGSGAPVIETVVNVNPGDVISVTVGSGGPGGSAGLPGLDGTPSSFGSLVNMPQGFAGQSNLTYAGGGGVRGTHNGTAAGVPTAGVPYTTQMSITADGAAGAAGGFGGGGGGSIGAGGSGGTSNNGGDGGTGGGGGGGYRLGGSGTGGRGGDGIVTVYIV